MAALLVALVANLLAPTETSPLSNDLVINEFMAANGTGLVDEEGDTSDWIELHNRGRQPVNLAGWFLSDDPARPEKWPFPNRSLGPDEYLVVFASGKDRNPTTGLAFLHTNFRLSRQGGFLGLYRVLDQRFIDVIEPQYPAQTRDMAYGRAGSGSTFSFLKPPTPGWSNDAAQSWSGRVEPVEFSVTRGFFEAPFTVVLTTTTPGATIHYTLDGSEPGEQHGQRYSQPIPVASTTLLRAMAFKPGFLPALSQTHSYLFLDAVVRQPANPPGFPYGADYEMDPRIVNNPNYSPKLLGALTAIPSLSLVTQAANLDIYQNPTERGVEWERPVSVELIDPADPARNFQVKAGVRIQGGVGRQPVFPKHSFRLFFKDLYGPTKLEQPIFPDSPVTEFDTLVLRGGVNRTYAGFLGLGNDADTLRKTTYARDEWLRRSQLAMSGLGARGIFVHLYLNGLYWGLYNLVERPDASFAAAYLGGEKEDWHAANLDGTVSGDPARFEKLHQLARQGGLEDPEKYAAIAELLDLPPFIDYVILNFYSGNTDWAHNNWYAANQNPAGRVLYFVWDGEKTWFEGAKTYLGKDEFGGKRNLVMRLFNALVQNPDFRLAFADRLHRHLSDDGALSDANSLARWRDINAPLEQAIIAESARWGDVVFDPPLTQADWRLAYQDVVAQMQGNADRLLALARQAGYYPPLDPPQIKLEQLTMSSEQLANKTYRLSMLSHQTSIPQSPFTLHSSLFPSSPASKPVISYTLDGTDPRLAGGQLAPTAQLYSSPLVLTQTTVIKARLHAQDQWSALAEATLDLAGGDGQIVLTELMYHPPEGGDTEFIELQNRGARAVSLANASFAGIRFTFPPKVAPLRPGEIIVLVRNASAFAAKYPGVTIAGVYQGNLSNSGETVTLRAAEGAILSTVAYSDGNGWPISPDGRGDSLVLVAFEGDLNDPHSWRASPSLGGSPGQPTALPGKAATLSQP